MCLSRVRCPLSSEKLKSGGGYGHKEKTEHQAPLFSALGFVTIVQLVARGHYARERWRGLILG